MIRHILVVCVGNICRSPMAEALLRRELRGQDEFTVESAGLGALVGHPASEYSVELMDEIGEDITGHRARQIHPDMVRDADLVLVMEAGHKRAITMRTQQPEARSTGLESGRKWTSKIRIGGRRRRMPMRWSTLRLASSVGSRE